RPGPLDSRDHDAGDRATLPDAGGLAALDALPVHVEAYSDWLAAMKSRLRLTPPKQRLAQRSGSRIRPMSLAAESRLATPARPSPPPQPHQRLPSVSQRIPSGTPVPQFRNTRPPASAVPPSTTSKTRISRG